jgi:hypothetical protein
VVVGFVVLHELLLQVLLLVLVHLVVVLDLR